MANNNPLDRTKLKRSANDFTKFPIKATLVDNDVFLLEDSADGYNKKRVLMSSIGTGGGTATEKLSDWYLPNYYELGLLYVQKAVVGNLAGMYWSSKETNAMYAWAKNMDSGSGSGSCDKESILKVRQIRFFDVTSTAGAYAVGNTLGQGKIFYVEESGKKGLIVALEDVAQQRWNNGAYGNYVLCSATEDTLYEGRANTIKIIDVQGAGNYAAMSCRNYGEVNGTPKNATYIVQTPNALLDNEQALSALATGILKSTAVTGVLSIAIAGTDLVAPNTTITGETKTKITYDSKGLVTGGTDATTVDIADSTDKRYCTDAQKTVIGNTSGVNTGDQDLSGKYSLDQTTPQTVTGTPRLPNLTLLEQGDPALPDATHGTLWVSDTNGKTNLNMIGSDGLKQRIGRDIVITCRNTSGATITKGKLVYVTGSTGSAANISLAKADVQSTLPTIGITMEEIPNTSYGRVQRVGRTEFALDTSAWTEGEILYASKDTAGALTNVLPVHPYYSQVIGNVIVKHAVNGSMLINIDAYYNGHSAGTIHPTYIFGETTATSQKLAKTATAQRTATFPDKSGTVAFTSDVDIKANKGANTDITSLLAPICNNGIVIPESIIIPPTVAGQGTIYVKTVSDGAYVSDANTLLLLHMEDAGTDFIDSSGTPKIVTVSGTALHSTVQKKFGTRSLIPGSSGSLTFNKDQYFDFGTGDFTIDAWIYLSNAASLNGLFSGYPDGWLGLMSNNGYMGYFVSAEGGGDWAIHSWGGTIPLSSTTWTHVAFVRHVTNWSGYINGALDCTFESSCALRSCAEVAHIGTWISDGNGQLTGYIDEFRISNIARWTAPFTPSAQTAGGLYYKDGTGVEYLLSH